jgi:hypothetical protein
MESTGGSRLVKLPTFDGAHEKFQHWWTRFLVFATVYKFVEALKRNPTDPYLPATEE